MTKTYVLDTNVLLSDPAAIFAFEDNDLVIPMVVLEELDNNKTRQDEVGRNAREVNRTLDDLRSSGSLTSPVRLRTGGTLRVATMDSDALALLPAEMESFQKTDNLIIAFMLSFIKTRPVATTVLVSKDINVRVKCDVLGIKSEDYLNQRVAQNTDELYRGVEVIEVDDVSINKFYAEGWLTPPEGKKFFSNQIVVVKSPGNQSALTRCINGNLRPLIDVESAFGLKPRNKEQKFSLDLLFDDSVKLVTLVGPAGTGKTLLALAAGLDQLKGLGTAGRFQKMIVSRPVQPMGNDIGFLPGTLQEKMDPWVSPIRDNLNFLMGYQKKASKGNRGRTRVAITDEPYLAMLQEEGKIEIEALAFIRGRSLPDAYIVIDEAQNLSMHELKTIITRVGDGTKIVLTGDIEQIDNPHLDIYTNGLTYAVEKFKEHSIAGHVTLIKGERSELATLASKIL
jgi:PhoH-like ATPase